MKNRDPALMAALASNHRLAKLIFPADGWADLWQDLNRAGAGTPQP